MLWGSMVKETGSDPLSSMDRWTVVRKPLLLQDKTTKNKAPSFSV